ncbi:MAG: hypothetical protein AB7V45_13510 [Candidatus Krumholzibacteriia bacterium]
MQLDSPFLNHASRILVVQLLLARYIAQSCTLRFCFAFLSLLILVVTPGWAVDQNDSFKFPDVIGTTEWTTYTWDEKIALTTVPDSVLAGMSTDEVAQLCLEHPFRHGFMATDIPARGMDYVVGVSNCYQELLRRSDSGPTLVRRYTEAVANRPSQVMWDRASVRYSMDLSVYELLLARDEVMASLSGEDREILLRFCMSDFETRQGYLPKGFMGILISKLLVQLEDGANKTAATPEFRRLEDLANGRCPLYRKLAADILSFKNKYSE